MFEVILIVVFIFCLVTMSFAIYFYGRKKKAENKKIVYVARALEGCSFNGPTRIRLIKMIDEKGQGKRKNK